MNPDATRARRSRALRITINVLLVPLWAVVAFICINSFEKYTEVGDLALLTLILFFALWAWWYAEDRDQRRAIKHSLADGDGHASPNPNGDVQAPAAN